jgi:DNA-binding MarR family transcriptional regulator
MSPIMRKQVDNVNHKDPASISAPRSASPADAVLELVHAVMHQFRSLQYQVLRDGAHHVTHMESKVMGFFARQPGATLSDLVQHSGRDKAQLARLVKGLRERELLVAEADTSDRRNVHLSLSDEGHAVQRALRLEARTLNSRAVDGLTAKEQALLADLLARVKANLDPPG